MRIHKISSMRLLRCSPLWVLLPKRGPSLHPTSWFEQWRELRGVNVPPTWNEFKTTFLDHFFPLELKKAKMREFMNLRQGNMLVREYALKFTKLSKYASTIIANPRPR